MHPDDLHVTLVFLGDCEEATAWSAWRAACASPPASLTTRLSTPGVFGGGRAWALRLHDDGALRDWMEEHRPMLTTDQQPARPHLTIAWSRAAIDHPEMLEVMNTVVDTPLILDHLALLCRADPSRGGPTYRRIAEVELPSRMG